MDVERWIKVKATRVLQGLFGIHEYPILLFTTGQLGFIGREEMKWQQSLKKEKKATPPGPKTYITVNCIYVSSF